MANPLSGLLAAGSSGPKTSRQPLTASRQASSSTPYRLIAAAAVTLLAAALYFSKFLKPRARAPASKALEFMDSTPFHKFVDDFITAMTNGEYHATTKEDVPPPGPAAAASPADAGAHSTSHGGQEDQAPQA